MTNRHWQKIKLMLAIFGPGLVVMLADTDAGSIVTAAQTGAIWGYKMLSLQLVLIPILYITQEITIRLGIITQKGHGALIQQYFGKFWAWFSIVTLLVCCIGGIISQFSGLASIGFLFHIPAWVTMCIVIAFLVIITLTGSYRSVEKCAIFLGLFELVFVIVAYMAHPSGQELWDGLKSLPLHDSGYLYLAAANIGAVIMPWMVFYQQSAVVDKKLNVHCMRSARWDTAIGAVVTQIIMIAVIIITAVTIGTKHPGTSLRTIHQISEVITPFFGHHAGRIVFALGMMGASLVAALVISLTAAWALGEVTGYRCSLDAKGCEAPFFYGVYALVLLLGGLLVISGVNLVRLNIAIEVLNALLLPIVLGFLYLLARRALPEKYRLKGWYAVLVGSVFLITAGFGLISGVWGAIQ